jgi:hypothetical protein
MSADDSIDQEITICIDDVLDTLGLSGKQALLTHLERDAGLRKDTILENPELFRKVLGLVFGEHGAEIFEGWIVKKLVSSFKLKQASNLTLAKTIKIIRTAEKE